MRNAVCGAVIACIASALIGCYVPRRVHTEQRVTLLTEHMLPLSSVSSAPRVRAEFGVEAERAGLYFVSTAIARASGEIDNAVESLPLPEDSLRSNAGPHSGILVLTPTKLVVPFEFAAASLLVGQSVSQFSYIVRVEYYAPKSEQVSRSWRLVLRSNLAAGSGTR